MPRKTAAMYPTTVSITGGEMLWRNPTTTGWDELALGTQGYVLAAGSAGPEWTNPASGGIRVSQLDAPDGAPSGVISVDTSGNISISRTVASTSTISAVKYTTDAAQSYGTGTGYQFGDGNTRWYESADDTLKLNVGGNELLSITANIIGTTYPISVDTSIASADAITGDSDSGDGVYGISNSAAGVRGASTGSYGGTFTSTNGTGMYSSGTQGLYAVGSTNYGVRGRSTGNYSIRADAYEQSGDGIYVLRSHTLTANINRDDTLLYRSINGNSAYSESGSVLHLRRNIINVIAENGDFLKCSTDGSTPLIRIDKSGYIQGGAYHMSANNVGYGDDLGSITSGVGNVTGGPGAGAAISAGSGNTLIGQSSGAVITGLSYFVGVGRYSLLNVSGGGRSIAIGGLAGRYQLNGSTALTSLTDSILVGYNTKAANGISNAIAIGHEAEAPASNTVTLGNTNITDTYLRGKIQFAASGDGLQFGELVTVAGTAQTALATQNTWYQITTWAANGEANGATPDYTTADITVSAAGVYWVNATMHFVSADVSQTYEVRPYKNNGGTALAMAAVESTGADGEIHAAITGLTSLAAGDTLEMWMRCTSGDSKSATFKHGNLTCAMIGGN